MTECVFTLAIFSSLISTFLCSSLLSFSSSLLSYILLHFGANQLCSDPFKGTDQSLLTPDPQSQFAWCHHGLTPPSSPNAQSSMLSSPLRNNKIHLACLGLILLQLIVVIGCGTSLQEAPVILIRIKGHTIQQCPGVVG